MYQKAKQFTLARPRVKKSLGIFLVVVGIVALIAPILPGAPIIFIGLELLGFRLLFLDKILKRKAVVVPQGD
jgi:uncharacterized protein YqgC (DUF456 family)